MKAFKIITYSLLLFLIFGAFTFAALTYLVPDKKIMESSPLETLQNPELKARFQLLKDELDSLKTDLKISQNQMGNKQLRIDSLKSAIAQKDIVIETTEKELDRLNRLLAAKTQQEDQTKELAKTFETMKTSELSPLLLNLDDETIIRIYEKMNNRSRKNLLLALSDRRASNVTRKIANLISP